MGPLTFNRHLPNRIIIISYSGCRVIIISPIVVFSPLGNNTILLVNELTGNAGLPGLDIDKL